MEGFWLLILKCIYVLMPAYIANMSPPLVKRFRILEPLNVPVDHGKNFRDKKPVLGRNKTYRGFIVGMLGGIIGAYIQMALLGVPFFRSLTVDASLYSTHIGVIAIGALLGFGAIAGDSMESFIKRRLSIEPGKSFVPWDQIDLVIGAYLFALPLLYPYISWMMFLISVAATFFLHILVNHTAFYFRIRKEKW